MAKKKDTETRGRPPEIEDPHRVQIIMPASDLARLRKRFPTLSAGVREAMEAFEPEPQHAKVRTQTTTVSLPSALWERFNDLAAEGKVPSAGRGIRMAIRQHLERLERREKKD